MQPQRVVACCTHSHTPGAQPQGPAVREVQQRAGHACMLGCHLPIPCSAAFAHCIAAQGERLPGAADHQAHALGAVCAQRRCAAARAGGAPQGAGGACRLVGGGRMHAIAFLQSVDAAEVATGRAPARSAQHAHPSFALPSLRSSAAARPAGHRPAGPQQLRSHL